MQNEKVSRPLLLFFVLTGAAAYCSVTSAADTTSLSDKKSSSSNNAKIESEKPLRILVTKPTSMMGLLKNIKYALSHNLLLNRDFYSEENFKSVFGNTEVAWRTKGDPKRLSAYLIGYDWLSSAVPNSNLKHTIQVDIWRRALDGGGAQAVLTIVFPKDASTPTVEDIEAVFGVGWKRLFDEETIRRFEFGGRENPTHPLGNETIQFASQDGDVRQLIKFILFANGAIQIAYFSEENGGK